MESPGSKLEKALVLLSGGVDSAVSLYWSLSQGWDVGTIEFDYHLRPEREKQACRELRARADIETAIRIPMEFLREVSDIPAEAVLNPLVKLAPEGYIPSRNLIFYSLCAHYAEVNNVRYIVGGHNSTDADTFQDAGRRFFDGVNHLLTLGIWSSAGTKTQVLQPLLDLGKPDVIRLGMKLGVPFELTWSCYHDRERPCGSCESCLEREQAFAAAGQIDPYLPTTGNDAPGMANRRGHVTEIGGKS